MTYFSRLTDIVTCNLTAILEEAKDPKAALDEIILEMNEGLAGAQRSVKTASNNENRLKEEIFELNTQVDHWTAKARDAVSSNNENDARNHLMRKKESEALLAGLKQQLTAASATRDHLTTTLHALQARLADAQRRLADIGGAESPASNTEDAVDENVGGDSVVSSNHSDQIEEELAAMKRELGQG